jgi:hypothetical protein
MPKLFLLVERRQHASGFGPFRPADAAFTANIDDDILQKYASSVIAAFQWMAISREEA